MSSNGPPSPPLHGHSISPTSARVKWQKAVGGETRATKQWHAAIDGALQVAVEAKSSSEVSASESWAADRRKSCLSKKKNLLELSQSANLSLAELLRGRGDFDRALPIYETCLEERKRYLGDDHPHTLLLVSAVAFTLHLKGDHARAMPLFDRCLSSWVGTLGEDHANTVLCRTRRDACAVRLPPPASPRLRPPASPLLPS
jgi:hypothetical protein